MDIFEVKWIGPKNGMMTFALRREGFLIMRRERLWSWEWVAETVQR